MSSAHPTITAWERDPHEGHYDAELHDWKLRVVWKTGGHANRGMFHWEATRDEDSEHGHAGFVEIEDAMADAEHFAALDARKRSARIAAVTNGA
jgi:hypothetical protein